MTRTEDLEMDLTSPNLTERCQTRVRKVEIDGEEKRKGQNENV